MATEYPPPRIDELLSERVAHYALKPSYDDMASKARALGQIILTDIAPKLPKEVFDVMCIIPRGGFMVNDVLTHAFGYHGREVQTIGTSSYEDDGITKAHGVRFTQLPDPANIKGHHALVLEDVCDTGETLYEGKKLLLNKPYSAANVTTGVTYYKPDKSSTGFVPDYFVEQTDKWIVFPGEVYEQLGLASLDQKLWLP